MRPTHIVGWGGAGSRWKRLHILRKESCRGHQGRRNSLNNEDDNHDVEADEVQLRCLMSHQGKAAGKESEAKEPNLQARGGSSGLRDTRTAPPSRKSLSATPARPRGAAAPVADYLLGKDIVPLVHHRELHEEDERGGQVVEVVLAVFVSGERRVF